MNGNCPPPDQLQRFALGALQNPPAAEVETHLLACAKCQQTTANLKLSDTFVDAVREGARQVGARSPDDQVRLERLMRSASDAKLHAGHADRDERSAATQPPAIGETLPPRQAPGTPRAATVPPNSPATPAGATHIGSGGLLGPYRLLEKLGEGGMGAV